MTAIRDYNLMMYSLFVSRVKCIFKSKIETMTTDL